MALRKRHWITRCKTVGFYQFFFFVEEFIYIIKGRFIRIESKLNEIEEDLFVSFFFGIYILFYFYKEIRNKKDVFLVDFLFSWIEQHKGGFFYISIIPYLNLLVKKKKWGENLRVNYNSFIQICPANEKTWKQYN